ncbi:MAG: sulfotransferase domain-containing protein [Pseudomonadota bacterium]
MTLKNIVWLASYPKSGNTWTRIFLANFIFNPEEPMPINQVHRLGMGDAITKSYKMVCKGPFNPTDHIQSLKLRNRVLRGIVNNRADINFIKSHNLKSTAFGYTLIPTEFSKSAVYIIRDPRDMIISYAKHYGQTLDRAINSTSRSDNTTAANSDSVKQFLGSWSEHVKTWTAASDVPLLVQRYEDMISDPKKTFGELLDFIGLPYEQPQLEKAIAFSSIGEMKKQEEVEPFVERSSNSGSFFGRGTSGHWREVLTEEQAKKIEDLHGAMMRKFGYL